MELTAEEARNETYNTTVLRLSLCWSAINSLVLGCRREMDKQYMMRDK
jgi:hypothetical protein